MRTLVLNAGYEPLAVVSFKRAILLVMNEKATVILHDEDNPVHATNGDWVRPSVILLTRYVRTPRVHQVPVSRRGVLRPVTSWVAWRRGTTARRCTSCSGTAR